MFQQKLWLLLFSYLSRGDGYLLEGLEITNLTRNLTGIHILNGKNIIALVTNLESNDPDLEKPHSLG